MAKQDDFTRYTIRIPHDLYVRVQMSAEDAGRSVNAEITATLEEKYPQPNSRLEGLRALIKTAERLKRIDPTGEIKGDVDALIGEIHREIAKIERTSTPSED